MKKRIEENAGDTKLCEGSRSKSRRKPGIKIHAIAIATTRIQSDARTDQTHHMLKLEQDQSVIVAGTGSESKTRTN